MTRKNPKETEGVMKSVLTAYFILVLHALLIAGLGFLVLFFRGLVNYMLWIFLGGTALVIISGYLFWRRMKAEGKTLREMLNSPTFRGRTVEVSLLGGLATFKVGNGEAVPAIGDGADGPALQLEAPASASARVRDLGELARLLENDLITMDEFNRTKQQLMNG
ncbi:MAG: SHOCT domain-containing protein [Desulfobacterales bacterium]|nr:SHOCT domain-containing protein [Desulfobacterales bacterium]